MNKVLQAAGRVIRTSEDEGVILLLDDRFLRREYLELFPREWEHYHMVNRNNVEQCIEDFWESRK
jgi:Rad3-related DNA helicase